MRIEFFFLSCTMGQRKKNMQRENLFNVQIGGIKLSFPPTPIFNSAIGRVEFSFTLRIHFL